MEELGLKGRVVAENEKGWGIGEKGPGGVIAEEGDYQGN